MIARAILFAAAFGTALAFTAPARADIPVGFFLGSGPSNWLPKCKAPEVLTELKDRNGKIRWVCAAKRAPANTQASGMRGGYVTRR